MTGMRKAAAIPGRRTYRGAIDVCGINNLLYYDLRNKLAYRYVYPANQRTWLLGSPCVTQGIVEQKSVCRNKCGHGWPVRLGNPF